MPFLMKKVPVYLYFLMMSLAVEGLMDNLLPALAMERCSEKTKLTSYWRTLMNEGVL